MTVEYKGKTLPLYLAEIPLNMGEICDLPNEFASLDFEFYGEADINYQQIDRTMKPDNDITSSFQIFGITLEKAPFLMDMVQTQPGNVFYANEKASVKVSLKGVKDSKGILSWSLADIDGKEVMHKEQAFAVKSGAEQIIDIDFPGLGVGYYYLTIG